MAAIEQGQLRISGIPCDSPPFRLQISQGFNRHGRMTAGLWIPEETRKELHLNMQVILELDGRRAGFLRGGGKSHSRKGERAGLCVPRGKDWELPGWSGKRGSVLSRGRDGAIRSWLGRLRPRTRDTLCGKPGREGKRSAVSCSSMRKQTGNSSAGRYPQGGNGLLPGIPFSRKRVLYRPAGQPVRGGNTIRPLQYKEPSSRKCPGGWDDMHRSGVCVEGLR